MLQRVAASPLLRIAVTVLVGLLVVAPTLAAAATFVVTSTGDEGDASLADGMCLTAIGTCTLRAAIQQANASVGPHTIMFAIPGPEPHTITPLTALPTITTVVTVDGYSQPGATPNTNPTDPAIPPRLGSNAVIMVEISGASVSANGLVITAGSSTVRGLAINRFPGAGIFLLTRGGNRIEGNFVGTDVHGVLDLGNGGGINISASPDNVIGGVTPAARNVISGNGAVQVHAFGGSPRTVIQGNLIGTTAAGTAAVASTSQGITLAVSADSVIGGNDADDGDVDGLVQARNVLSGNGTGLLITSSPRTRVQGNFIGTDVTGTAAIANNTGAVVTNDAPDVLIGGPAPGASNLISGNVIGLKVGPGINMPRVTVQGNFIGTEVDGVSPLGNTAQGMSVSASEAVIGGLGAHEGNVIAFTANAGPGIVVGQSAADGLIAGNSIHSGTGRGVFVDSSARRIWITGNSIHANGLLGIDLVSASQAANFVTLNDVGDADTGANELQNFPVIVSAASTASSTTIAGTLNSTANGTFTIEFFASTAGDPSGFGEGEIFIGSTSVGADASGNASFSVTVPLAVLPGHVVTATATDASGNTSEFSNWLGVASGNRPPVANAGADQSVNEEVAVTLDGSGSSDPDGNAITYQWQQIGGVPVTLENPTTVMPTFTAPLMATGSTTLTFQLVVNDGALDSVPDVVNVTVVNVNHAPVAIVGANQVVDEGSPVALDGAASYDPDGETISYAWEQISGPAVTLSDPASSKPTFAAPLIASGGSVLLQFRLVVDDGQLFSDPVVTSVTVENVNHPPLADAGADQTRDEGALVMLNGTNSSDPDGDALHYHWTQVAGPTVTLSDATSPSPTFIAPLVGAQSQAALKFQLIVDDGSLSSAPDDVTVQVQGADAPPICDLAQASPSLLWPPNHKLIRVAIVGVRDPDNNRVSITITGVTQDEPVDGLGDGDTSPDAVHEGANLLLRAERSGLGNGRVYQIGFRADDGSGGFCTGTVGVCVPHDMGKGRTCVDDGQHYDSAIPAVP